MDEDDMDVTIIYRNEPRMRPVTPTASDEGRKGILQFELITHVRVCRHHLIVRQFSGEHAPSKFNLPSLNTSRGERIGERTNCEGNDDKPK
jgi:hypothetical protein